MKKLLLALALFLLPISAEAATCFWVGGTGSWSTANTASWASSTGGTTGTCAATGGIPKQAADTAIFDGASGGGTVTADTTINGITLTGITEGAHTGALDFSVNNPSITIAGSLSTNGAGTRTLNIGSGTWTFTRTTGSAWFDFTTSGGLTFAGTGTFLIQPPTKLTNAASLGLSTTFTIPNITINLPSYVSTDLRAAVAIFNAGTVTNLTITNAYWLQFPSMTVTNGFSINGGTSSQPILINNGTTTALSTLTLGGTVTCNWCSVQNIVKAGAGSFTATNSFDLGGNSGVTITAPSTGGGHIIGG